jgi:drug/metabolite transporter superfamily protein YnfA
MFHRSANRAWFWGAVALTLVKLWLAGGLTVFAIGPAIHDDRLFVDLAGHLIDGRWLGPYNQFTLAKGPMFPLFIAGTFWLGLPLIFAQQLLYAAASAAVTGSLGPWLRTGAARFILFAVLLWNPMSFDAGNLSRVMRQNLYTPLALFCVAGLILLFARRREVWSRQAGPAGLAGLSLGCFWLTREESVWFLPAVGLLLLGGALALGRELLPRWRTAAASLGCFILTALIPILTVSALNLRHYGWFGTVEFHSAEFKAAYGALTRLKVGPELDQVPVTRQMREKAYELSPTFARIRPYFETFVTDNWSEKVLFPAAERQIRGGWMVWALRDALTAAGMAPDAGTALRHFQLIADELNAACDAGLVPAHPRRSGFLPPLTRRQVGPLIDTAAEYGAFFIFFRDFKAETPDSLGDYAELKPFRNVVGRRLSFAPRSLLPATPEQDRRDAWKVQTLGRIGGTLAQGIAMLGPLLLLAGLARGIESAVERRVSFPLGLAAAMLAACAAYLAINILVQVTSFYNMSPAALASAYPLYLIALAAIVLDAVQAWRRPAGVTPVKTVARPRPAWLAAGGAALAVFAARLAEVHLHASDVPYNDQWVIEAQQIIEPWLNGSLGLRDFFRPHFEHLPVWTRLLAWLQVAATGRWDPLVQMTVNAALHAGFIWLAARWIWSVLRPVPATAVTALLLLAGALPHAWENIAWGFQSQFPLALIFLFLHVHGVCCHPPGSRGWWLAQAAALAGLFTLASLWLAPLAVCASWLWTGPRRRADLLIPGLIAAVGAGILALIHFTGEGSFTQVPRTAGEFLHSCLHLLGWPSILPGAVAIVQLPWLVHALRLRAQAGTLPVDRMIFILGLVNCAQAVGLAFGRTGDNNDFVSRYGDLLSLGVLAGALALCRLLPGPGRARPVFFLVTVLWTGLVVVGLARNSTEGHAHYFHTYAAENAALRRKALQNYLTAGDRTVLEAPATRWVLSQDTALVTRLLDLPAFRALLPASVDPASPPDAAGIFVRRWHARWPWLLAAGGLLLLGGVAWQGWRERGRDPLPVMSVPVDPWAWRVAAVTGFATLLPMLVLSNPLTLDPVQRWQRWLGGEEALSGLAFSFTTPAAFGPEHLQGAAPLLPENLRNQFYGTAPAGPELTCTVVSSPFELTQSWLVVPYAGYPVGHGNGLRLRLIDDHGERIGEEIGCPGPNGDGIAYWVVDTRKLVGRRAQLVLYDGRTETEAWVAAAPPIPTDRPQLAVTLAEGLRNESHASAHASLGLIALVSFICVGLGWMRHRTR